MGTPEQSVRALLAGHGPLVALVGQRITPQLNTVEAEYPLVVYMRTGIEKRPKLDAGAKTGKVLIDVEIYAETEAGYQAAATEVVNALNGKRDLPNKVKGIFHVDNAAGVLGDDGPRFMRHTFAVWHTES